ncbi:MAG: hypothetical protein IJW70_07045 [Clostridia bacterium]|nr:hypothetical protein [Clostridia bacterium]
MKPFKLLTIVSISISVIVGICSALMAFPYLVKASVTETTLNNSYPGYTYEEAVEKSDRLEYCKLMHVDSPKYTEQQNGARTITTDYIFVSNENPTQYFILRLPGGQIDNHIVFSSDEAEKFLSIGQNYILMLNELSIDESSIYNVSNVETNIHSYYSLLLGTSSIFHINEQISYSDIVCSVNNVYSVEYEDLFNDCILK